MFQHSRHNHLRHFRNKLLGMNSCDRLVNEINSVSTTHIKCKRSRAQHNRRIAGYNLVSWLIQKNYSLNPNSTITMIEEIKVKHLHDLQCFRGLNFVTFARFVFAKNSLPQRSNVQVTTYCNKCGTKARSLWIETLHSYNHDTRANVPRPVWNDSTGIISAHSYLEHSYCQ